VPARCGGDEFAILLPNTDSAGAFELASRISTMISDHVVEEMTQEKISTSMGCATLSDNNVPSFEALVKLADDAMYQSKAQGKGKVIRG